MKIGNSIILLLACFVVKNSNAAGNYFAAPDSVITIKAIDSSKVYELGKGCVNCTVYINSDNNLPLKEYYFNNGAAVKYINYEYGKKQKLNSASVFNNDNKLIEKRIEYGKDANEYKATKYFEDGKVKESGPIKRADKNGIWTEYYGNGKMKTLTTYEMDKRNGKYSEYYENGKIKITGSYTNDVKLGYWTEYDTNGVFIKGHTYDLLSQYGLSKTDLQACVMFTRSSDSKFGVKLKSGDHIAFEYAGGKSIPDGVLKAVKNDTVYVSTVNGMGVDKEMFGIPVSEIVSVGYPDNVGGPAISGNGQGYIKKRSYAMIKMDDKKYSVNFYDENCVY